MARERERIGYVDGNTVRKLQPEPGRRTGHGRRPQRKPRQRVHGQTMNLVYVAFLTAAAGMLLWSCVQYLQLQAETTGRVKNIAAMETRLEELRKENDDEYTRIMMAVDLDYIRDVAINELHMVYAQPDQVILYDGGTRDYVRQNGEIPREEASLKEVIFQK